VTMERIIDFPHIDPADLSVAQKMILLVLADENRVMSTADLSDYTGMTDGGIRRALRGLRDQDIVNKTPDQTNPRRNLYGLRPRVQPIEVSD